MEGGEASKWQLAVDLVCYIARRVCHNVDRIGSGASRHHRTEHSTHAYPSVSTHTYLSVSIDRHTPECQSWESGLGGCGLRVVRSHALSQVDHGAFHYGVAASGYMHTECVVSVWGVSMPLCHIHCRTLVGLVSVPYTLCPTALPFLRFLLPCHKGATGGSVCNKCNKRRCLEHRTHPLGTCQDQSVLVSRVHELSVRYHQGNRDRHVTLIEIDI